eukprot:TRINITY_DN3277_c0_g3_i1.p1 TRINITY_DN3277_c0_g3~~TRINITY_DN3277_c0_g3_i1.p1  ORF type:complete len:595 (-),score=55.18 TRINITY_DN3277_c0_g3_i1:165-1757(-)
MYWWDERKLAAVASSGGGGGKEGGKKKEVKKQQQQQKAVVMTQPDPQDPLKEHYGDYVRIQSQSRSEEYWTDVSDLTPDLKDQSVRIRGRVHTVRGKGKSCFIVLRQKIATVQLVMFADDTVVSRPMVKYAMGISKESIIDVRGTLVCPEQPIEACTQRDVEIQVTDIHVVSRSDALVFEVKDAARSEAEVKAAEEAGEQFASVSQDLRLDNRFLDLRTPANQGIFKVQSGVCQLFREYLLSQNFQEIHSPKLIAGASEGGSAVFKLDYMGQSACLAQSPQLYKQMAICSDFGRVFEIGPVFRAEKSNTHRHMCEFTGLDFEMEIKEHYSEVLDIIEGLFLFIFEGLKNNFSQDLEAIALQYPFQPLQYKPLRLTFAEGIKMLKDAGYQDANEDDDLTTELEKALGQLVKEKYGTEFYILHQYPLCVRPFYTMPSAKNPKLSNSFDVFIRGEEIISGAQRIHDPELLVERAKFWEIPLNTIQPYIDSFKLGAVPHGGAGIGLERVVMLYANLGNIRKTSMFPRDPQRLTP